MNEAEMEIAKFLGNKDGLCMAKDKDGNICAIVSGRYRFRLQAISEALFGKNAKARTKLHE